MQVGVLGRQGRPQIARQGPVQRVERGDLRHVETPAAVFQLLAQLAVDEGVQHHARSRGDLLQHSLHLPVRADQGVDVLDGDDAVETGHDRLGHGVERLAGGVRHEVDVEVGGQARRPGGTARTHGDGLSMTMGLLWTGPGADPLAAGADFHSKPGPGSRAGMVVEPRRSCPASRPTPIPCGIPEVWRIPVRRNGARSAPPARVQRGRAR